MSRTPDGKGQKWVVEAGKIIHIGGLPYAVTHDIIVHGFHKPEWDVPTVKEANTLFTSPPEKDTR